MNSIVTLIPEDGGDNFITTRWFLVKASEVFKSLYEDSAKEPWQDSFTVPCNEKQLDILFSMCFYGNDDNNLYKKLYDEYKDVEKLFRLIDYFQLPKSVEDMIYDTYEDHAISINEVNEHSCRIDHKYDDNNGSDRRREAMKELYNFRVK